VLENFFLLQSIEANISWVGKMEKEKLQNVLAQQGIELVFFYEIFQSAHVRFSPEKLNALATIPFIAWIEKSNRPNEIHGSNAARENFRTGALENLFGLTGKGVNIGIWDGGMAGPHIDFVGRTTIRQSASGISAHATHVAGIMAGAGLVYPLWKGVATEATVFSYDIANAPPPERYIPYEMFQSIESDNIVLTQNSYGGNPVTSGTCGTGAAYYTESRSLDMLAYLYPSITHHYSVGNFSGNCISVTPPNGGYRSTAVGLNNAKNIITVGAIERNNTSLSAPFITSSWGPFRDGRIAPHVVALGRDVTSPHPYSTYAGGGWSGTSFSSPIISGVSALLYQKYRQLHANQNPISALIRGLISNGADDIGRPFPDYQFGFGKLNALKSLKILNQGNYLIDNVSQGNTQTYTAQITIPANTSRLKMMLTWTDPPALPTTGTALINNLNLQLTHDQSATSFNPWILDPLSPTNVAVRGIDNVNNIEQITIDNPTAGTYTIQVTGASINSPVGGSQEFALTWLVEPEYVEVTFPSGNEKLPPNNVELIQWDAEGTNNTFDIEYFDGTNWNTIVTGLTIAAGAPRTYNWTTPNIITDKAKVRVTGTKNSGGAISDESDANFTIMGIPLGTISPLILTGIAGNNQVTVAWQPVSGADSYDIYKIRQFDEWNGESQYQFVENVPASVTSYDSKGLVNGGWYFHTVVARTNSGIISERGHATGAVVPTGAGAATDLQTSNLVTPTSICSHNPPIAVKLKNVGLTAIPSGTVIPISYQIDALPTVTENLTLSADLLVNQEIDYSFATLPNFATPQSYKIVIRTSLASDGVKDNNKIEATILRNSNLLAPPLSIEISPSANFCGTATLTAKGFPIDTYVQNTITFASENTSGATAVTLGDDDVIKLPIGFNFNFYGNTYSEFFLNSNGLISFDKFEHDYVASLRRNIPNPLVINNFVALAWSDLDPSAGGTIKYQLLGTAPNRRLVIEYSNVPYYSSVPPSPFRVSGQIVLYETTHVIEIHSINIQDDGNDKIMGLESSQGVRGIAAIGRNNIPWAVTNESLRFIPSNTTLQWSSGQISPYITTTSSGIYSFSITQNNCNHSANTTISSTCDAIKPQITTLSPADNSVSVATNANLVLTFDKQVRAGSGNITIIGGAMPVVIPISGGITGTVTFNTNTITINPTANLLSNTAYYVLIDAGAIRDYSTPPNSFDGITAPTTWNFNTANTAPTLDNANNFILSMINQNDTNPVGNLISDIFNTKITDPDPNPQRGIAIITANNSSGTWQYSLDNGASWTDVGNVSPTNALLLPDNARVRFVPNPSFHGNSLFTIQAWDRTTGTVGGTANLSAPASAGGTTAFSTHIGTATIKINARPTIAPIANQATNEDTSLSISFIINDLDDDVNVLVLSASSSNPTLVGTPNISFSGTGNNRTVQISPLANQFGTTTIHLTVSDGNTSSTTSFILTVNPVNDPPTIVSFNKNTTTIGRIDFTSADFTAAYTDVENTPLTKIKIQSLPINGSLLLNNSLVAANQEINASDISNLHYIPSLTFVGNTSFTWSASDGTDYALTPAQVNISIALGNVPPTVSDFSKTVLRNQAFTFQLSDFANAFTDMDNNALTRIRITQLPNHGVLMFNNAAVGLNQEILASQVQLLSYLSSQNFIGNDSFEWNGSDGFTYANVSADVNLNIISGNKPPTITNFIKEGIENQILNLRLNDFQNAYQDPEQSPLQKIKILSLPNQGILYLGKNPVNTNQEIFAVELSMLHYQSIADFNGIDAFTWNASDGEDYATTLATTTLKIVQIIPIAPQKLVARAMSSSVQLSWEANPENNIAYYEIYIFSANSSQRLIGNTLGNNFLINNLQNGITYSFRIKAVTRSGASSEFSQTVQGRPSIVLAEGNTSYDRFLQVYPNPTSKNLTIELDLPKPEVIHFYLTDLLGKVIEKGSSEKLQNKYMKVLDMSKLAQGIYLLQIEAGEMKVVRKIVKE
jgi:hypothetical protein